MKFIKSTLFTLLLIGAVSCQDDDKTIVSASGLVLDQPEGGTDFTVTTASVPEDNIVTFRWHPANNGVPSVSAYAIEVAKAGTNFENAISGVKSTDVPPTSEYTWTLAYLNNLAHQIGFEGCEPVDVDVRIKSTLGTPPANANIPNGTFVQYSNVVTLHINPTIQEISFAKDGDDPALGHKLAPSSFYTQDYEGYMYLTPGTYKFYIPGTCGEYGSDVTVLGVSGTGSLMAGGAGYVVAAAGYYLVTADTGTAMSYSARTVSWGFYGKAKQTFPDGVTAMTYDAAADEWSYTTPESPASLFLKQGYGIRFKTAGTNPRVLGAFNSGAPIDRNAGTELTYITPPPSSSAAGFEIFLPGQQTDPVTTGRYQITLNLSVPRHYTYSVTQL